MSATNRGAVRKPQDSYYTPPYTVESLLSVLDLSSVFDFYEPCKGGGAIYDRVDVDLKDYAELSEGIDYLTTDIHEVDLIITNPPFSSAREFIEKSLTEAGSVWYLLRTGFLESKERAEWWQGREPTHLLSLSARPSFTKTGTDSANYAWFGWDKLGICELKPGIHILPYLKYKS